MNKPSSELTRIVTKVLGVWLTETAAVLGSPYELNLGRLGEALPYVNRAIGVSLDVRRRACE